jgi:hypothetical protein
MCKKHETLVAKNQKKRKQSFIVSATVANPRKLISLCFLTFAVKLGHFTINEFYLYVTNTQDYQRKTEKFFVSEEIKCHRTDYWSKPFFARSLVNVNLNLKILPR